MPEEGIKTKPHEELLTFEETARLIGIFASLGIDKVRITGGEPLVRKGITGLVRAIVRIEGIEEVCLTTNGSLLSIYAKELKEAGLGRINISIDTLKTGRFRKITRCSWFCDVLEGIRTARGLGFHPLKLNVVVMKGVNDDEIIDFVKFSLSEGLVLRFIEFMNVTPLWTESYFMPIEEVKRQCEEKFRLAAIDEYGPGPAVYYRIEREGIIGFINTNEYNCKRCSRLRLTSVGDLKLCLYDAAGLSLKNLLREGLPDSEIADIIRDKMGFKRQVYYKNGHNSRLYMCEIGG